ncbi:hypothetical protein Ctob_007092 [Chrysochromulina tobinii]|uniref:RRM domain-containing protein n=1 Tax=Chrysochromulina tobinii TaxID=1460289 RepID=A0A0M0JCP3_9EUKA|nr:hypothetical protein Ctob_007092 [Chrysochromulina tobinii]|eukprot:KOO24349.1 hypothetical protein Ctob_007092 [Chrysochromulina sp. CCMP291]
MVDADGRSRGCGTVLFSTTREAAKAIQLFNESFLLGRQIEVTARQPRRRAAERRQSAIGERESARAAGTEATRREKGGGGEWWLFP